MAEDSSHRLRWLVLALLLAGTVLLIRSRRRAAEGAAEPPWLPPVPDDRGRTVPAAAVAPVAAVPSSPPPAPEQVRPAARPRRTATVELPQGAAAALPDGSPPAPEYTVKAKAGSTLFHGPDSPYFARTKAEFWFRTAADARAAGLTEWTPRRRAGD